MYKRKVICSNPKHNGPAAVHPKTGAIGYILSSTKTLSESIPRRQECWDCGEARRAEEDRVKQDRLKRMFVDDELPQN